MNHTLTRRALLPLLVLLFGTAGAQAADILVPSQQPTIQEAINAAQDGDSIVVADGTYTGPGNNSFYIDRRTGLTIRSASGDPTKCIIDLGGNSTAFPRLYWQDGNPTWTGFTFQNGNGVYGGAGNIQFPVTITRCIFRNNVAEVGGGLLLRGPSPMTLSDCLFVGNSARGIGGGLYLDFTDANTVIKNCTFVGNSTVYGGGSIYYNGSESLTYNCILWGNSSTSELYGGQEIGAAWYRLPTLTNTTIMGGLGTTAPYVTDGGGISTADPLFVNAAAGDYRLSVGSPCLDSGLTSVVTSALDLAGGQRVVGPAVDRGAYELQILFTPGAKITGGGKLGRKVEFEFDVKVKNEAAKGSFEYEDETANIEFKATKFTSVLVSGTHATLTGTARVNGVWCSFTVEIDDHGTPGRGNDSFSLTLSTGYTKSGTLTGGNLRIR